MEDNRFLRTYQEYKREKQESRNYETTNRFDCLRETRPPIREENRFDCLRETRPPIREENRFDCLRNTASISNQDSRVVDKNNRFSCLIDNDYANNNQPKIQERAVTYLPRPEPRESINTTMKKYIEEKRVKLPQKPVFSIESEYHFPELNSNNIPSKEIKLPESKLQKEMIVNVEVIPINRKTITCMSFQNGKVITKEVYDDGTDVIPGNDVIIKKPQYSSWASVLKKDTDKNQ